MNPAINVSDWPIRFPIDDTYHHLLLLMAEGVTCGLLEVLQACQNVMLDLELCLHAVFSSLLNYEGLAGQSVKSAGSSQIYDDVGAALDLESEG